MVGHKNIQGHFSFSNFECQHIFFSPSVSLHLFIFTEAACINVTKGQLISKSVFFGRRFPPKNKRKQVNLRYHSSKVEFLLFVFCRKSMTPNNHFEINWPLGSAITYCLRWLQWWPTMFQQKVNTLHKERVSKGIEIWGFTYY